MRRVAEGSWLLIHPQATFGLKFCSRVARSGANFAMSLSNVSLAVVASGCGKHAQECERREISFVGAFAGRRSRGRL